MLEPMLSLIRRVRTLIRRGRFEKDMNDEFTFHLEMQIEKHMQNGMTPEEAKREAHKNFGGVGQIQETCRERQWIDVVESVLQDVRFGFRVLTKNPGYSVVAILTLALGIAAVTTMFSIVNEVLFKPIPIPNVDRIVHLQATDTANGNGRYPPTVADYFSFREQSRSFERLCATRFWFYTLSEDAEAEQIHGWRVAPGYFEALGVQPQLGRSFTDEEGLPGQDNVVVITHGLWQRRYGGDPEILGRTLLIDDRPLRVVGVLPHDFYPFTVMDREVELWMPISFTESERANREAPAIGILGLLKPGVTGEQAQAELDVIAQRLATEYPETNRFRGVQVDVHTESAVREIKPRLHLLSGAVGLVLLLACVNVAGLALVRGAARSREFAIRLALGAGRLRIVRQLIIESLLTSFAGGAIGVLISFWSIEIIALLFESELPPHATPSVDRQVCAFAIVISALAGVVFSLLPSLFVSSNEPGEVLKAQGRATTPGRGSQRICNLVVASELSLTLTLLVSTGLILQTVRNIETADRGFDLTNRLTMQIRLSQERYDSPEAIVDFYNDVLDRIRNLPGVKNAAAASFLPISNIWAGTDYEVSGRDSDPDNPLQAAYWVVSDEFFSTLDLPLQSGRSVQRSDNLDEAAVALVSRDIAELVWSNESVEENRIRLLMPSSDLPWDEGTGNDWLSIVGVAGDYRWFDGMDQTLKPSRAIYLPMSQFPRRMMHLVVHTKGPPFESLQSVTDVINQVDPNQPIAFVRSYNDVVMSAFETRRIFMIMLSVFSGMAILLAVVGTYGVVAYQTSRRVREFGIRLALGAGRREVLNLVLSGAIRLAILGLGPGLLLSFATVHAVRSELYGIGAFDVSTFVGVSLLLFFIVTIASSVPAIRATWIEPIAVLRDE